MSNKGATTELNHIMDAASSNTSKSIMSEDVQTIKPVNAKQDFTKAELLKLLSYMEGELQARDIVIAVLKSEKVKNLVNIAAYGAPVDKLKLNDPHAALFRDSLALSGNVASRHTSAIAAQSERDARELCEQQLLVLSHKVDQQRQTHAKIINLLKFTRDKHLKVMQELEDEKKKNTLDIPKSTSNAEQSKLQEKLTESEVTKEQLKNEVKKLLELLEAERTEHKEIVIYLMEERKKMNMMRNEERKRSEDLAQILSEEKQRVDTIADGLEEETKKSLRLEAEMEKQSQVHEQERKMMVRNLAAEEKKVKDLETEITRLRIENEALKKAALAAGANPMSVAKVIQPTATVSSVPVSGPTTGIARSISPGQVLRQEPNSSPIATGSSNVATIIRAHSVQSGAPQPPVKKSTFGTANVARVAPPIPPNKPVINKNSTTVAANRSISFLQSGTVPGVSSAAQAIAAQNAKDDIF
ncbi:CTTNBP2 N-terminal-like protein isoform X1 [Chironomus tepperi]|uniref:CTTNBP2 N-terminal-like protein isoform X1 n=1 Tax=Chironomus tepperi TaxID=113505 RepID=UPI00391F7D5D